MMFHYLMLLLPLLYGMLFFPNLPIVVGTPGAVAQCLF
jgi:hypothetical protein